MLHLFRCNEKLLRCYRNLPFESFLKTFSPPFRYTSDYSSQLTVIRRTQFSYSSFSQYREISFTNILTTQKIYEPNNYILNYLYERDNIKWSKITKEKRGKIKDYEEGIKGKRERNGNAIFVHQFAENREISARYTRVYPFFPTIPSTCFSLTRKRKRFE